MFKRQDHHPPSTATTPPERGKTARENQHVVESNPLWQRLATGASDTYDCVITALVRLRTAYASAVGLDLSQFPPSLEPAALFEYVLHEKFVSQHAEAESKTPEANASIARRCAQAIAMRFRMIARAEGQTGTERAEYQSAAVDTAVNCLAEATARLFDAIDLDSRLIEEFKQRRAARRLSKPTVRMPTPPTGPGPINPESSKIP
jgi:hypothetical protein